MQSETATVQEPSDYVGQFDVVMHRLADYRRVLETRAHELGELEGRVDKAKDALRRALAYSRVSCAETAGVCQLFVERMLSRFCEDAVPVLEPVFSDGYVIVVVGPAETGHAKQAAAWFCSKRQARRAYIRLDKSAQRRAEATDTTKPDQRLFQVKQLFWSQLEPPRTEQGIEKDLFGQHGEPERESGDEA